jgi:hypothetical protein
MPKYVVGVIEQVDREYVVEADNEEIAFHAFDNLGSVIRLMPPPYETTKRKPDLTITPSTYVTVWHK